MVSMIPLVDVHFKLIQLKKSLKNKNIFNSTAGASVVTMHARGYLCNFVPLIAFLKYSISWFTHAADHSFC